LEEEERPPEEETAAGTKGALQVKKQAVNNQGFSS
jgi:hypothetical protein